MTDEVTRAVGGPLDATVGRPQPERATATTGYARVVDGPKPHGLEWDDDYGDDGPERDTTCKHCHGTGGDPWNDGILPCEHCDGEGYEWWN